MLIPPRLKNKINKDNNLIEEFKEFFILFLTTILNLYSATIVAHELPFLTYKNLSKRCSVKEKVVYTSHFGKLNQMRPGMSHLV